MEIGLINGVVQCKIDELRCLSYRKTSRNFCARTITIIADQTAGGIATVIGEDVWDQAKE
jgi:hypothetical protein